MTDESILEIFDCSICEQDIRNHVDPYTQSFISAGVDSGETPCGKRVIHWRHFGCMQQLYLKRVSNDE
jgi:hypothetical protein